MAECIFHDAIHSGRRKNQTSADGDTTTDIATTSAPGGHRDPLALADGENFRNLGGVTRKGDRFREGRDHPGIAGVGAKGGGIEADYPGRKASGEGAKA